MTQVNLNLYCACEYNLRGLPLEGNCPECGRPIQQSLGRTAPPDSARYRLIRVALVSLALGAWAFVAASDFAIDVHPLYLWYIHDRVATVGTQAGVAALMMTIALLGINGRSRRDRLVWICFVFALWAAYWGSCIMNRPRE